MSFPKTRFGSALPLLLSWTALGVCLSSASDILEYYILEEASVPLGTSASSTTSSRSWRLAASSATSSSTTSSRRPRSDVVPRPRVLHPRGAGAARPRTTWYLGLEYYILEEASAPHGTSAWGTTSSRSWRRVASSATSSTTSVSASATTRRRSSRCASAS